MKNDIFDAKQANPMLRAITFLLLTLALIVSGITAAYSQPADEYTIKAVWLERFTRFIEWPKESHVNDARSKFTIGIIGNDEFNGKLEKIYQTQKIKNKNVTVIKLHTIDEIDNCDLLYISSSESGHLKKIVEKTRTLPVLTIAGTNGFCQKGVLINFYWDNSNIKFEINEKAVKESGLYFEFRLLSAATIINRVIP